MHRILLRLLCLAAIASPLTSVQSSAAQEATLNEQLDDAYAEFDALQQPLIDGVSRQSRESIAEIAPALIEIATRIIGIDSAAGGMLTREQLGRMYGIRGVSHLALDETDRAEADMRRAGSDWAGESGFYQMRFLWAYNAENWAGIVDALEFEQELAGGLSDTLIGNWEPRMVGQLGRQIGADEAAKERFAEFLIRSGWVDTVRPKNRNWVYWDLFEARSARGDEEGARNALAGVTSLRSLANILIEERYARYRASVEAAGGADLAKAAENQSRALSAEWDENSGDVEYLLDYLIILRMQGRWQDIVDRFAPIADDLSGAIDADAQDHLLMNASGFFLVNYLAHAQLMLGDIDGGLARMEEIVDLGVEARPELISQAINRLSWLYELGRYPQALGIARTLDELPEGIASDYAYGLIYQAAACSAFQTGDQGQLEYWRGKLLAIDDLSTTVRLDYYFCTADEDAAAELIIAELQGEEPADLLFILQDMALWQANGPNDLAMEAMRARVVARPDVGQALAAVGDVRRFALTTFYN